MLSPDSRSYRSMNMNIKLYMNSGFRSSVAAPLLAFYGATAALATCCRGGMTMYLYASRCLLLLPMLLVVVATVVLLPMVLAFLLLADAACYCLLLLLLLFLLLVVVENGLFVIMTIFIRDNGH